MYSKKAVYFNYKSFAASFFLLLFPAALVMLGGSMAIATLSLYPILGGVVIAVIIAFPGLPRLLAINANADLKLDKFKDALKKIKTAGRLPFAPVSVHIFAAYVLILNGMLDEAKEKIDEIRLMEMSLPEKSKYSATFALLDWLRSGSAEKGLEKLAEINRRGADEAVYYVAGKLMNICREPAEARKYNEEAMEMHPGNRGIMENLVISYCRTGQDKDAKLLFRNLYYDLKATSDSFYYMAGIKIKENKKSDAVDFMKAALETEEASTCIISRSEMEKRLKEAQETSI